MKRTLSISFLAAAIALPVGATAQQQDPGSRSSERKPLAQRQSSERQTAGQQSRQAQDILVVSAGEIAQNPQLYYGRKIQVQAEVEQVYGRTVFALDEERLFAGPDVLVIAPGGTRAPAEGQSATVTGTLRSFLATDVYRDYDWFGYGWYGYNWADYDHVWRDWERRPAIIADSVRMDNGRELVMQQTRETPSEKDRNPRLVYATSPGAIAEDPLEYAGSMVQVRAEIADTLNPHAFTLDEDRLLVTTDLLVLVPRPTGRPAEGSTVTVVGQVRPFIRAEFEQDYDWFEMGLLPSTGELQNLETERRPVIIARSVKTDTGRELVQRSASRQEPAVGGSSQ